MMELYFTFKVIGKIIAILWVVLIVILAIIGSRKK